MKLNKKIALISDIHYRGNSGTKKGISACKSFQHVICEIEKHNPTMLLDLGDRITDESAEKDVELLTDISKWYNKLPYIKRYLFGNHDLRYMDHKKNSEILGCKEDSWLEDINEQYQFLYWNPKIKYKENLGFSLVKGELEYLKELLNKAKRKVMIFSHFPLDGRPTKGNYYFDSKFSYIAYLVQQEKIMKIIEDSEKVIACINGHMHWNNLETIDGIHYISIPSLTESYMNSPEPMNAFGIMNLDNNTIELEIFGRQPIYYRLPVKNPEDHWLKWKDS